MAAATQEKPGTRVGFGIPTTVDELPPGREKEAIKRSLRAFKNRSPRLRKAYERLAVAAQLNASTQAKLAKISNVNCANNGTVIDYTKRELGNQLLREMADQLNLTLEELTDKARPLDVIDYITANLGRKFTLEIARIHGIRGVSELSYKVPVAKIIETVSAVFGELFAMEIAAKAGMSLDELTDKTRWCPLWVFQLVIRMAAVAFSTVHAPLEFARNFSNFSWGPGERAIKLLSAFMSMIPSWLAIGFAARLFLLLIPILMPDFNKNKRAWVRFRTWLWSDDFVTIDTRLNPGVHPIRDDSWSMELFVPITYTQVPSIVSPCKVIYPLLKPKGVKLEGDAEHDFISGRPVRPEDHFQFFIDWREACSRKLGHDLIDPHVVGNEFYVNDQVVMVRVVVERLNKHTIKVRRVRATDSATDQRFDGWLATETIKWGDDPATGYPVNVITKGQIFCTERVRVSNILFWRREPFPLRCQFSYKFPPLAERYQQAVEQFKRGLRETWQTLRHNPGAFAEELKSRFMSWWQLQKEVREEVHRIRKAPGELMEKMASEQPELIELAEKTETEIKTALTEWAASYDKTGKYTRIHVQGVSRDARELGERLKRRYPNCREIIELDLLILEYAALVHDVGKADVPDEILNAPGEIAPEKRVFMGFHVICTIIRLLEALPEGPMKELIITIAGGHHLIWGPDGGYGGYPTKTAGPDTHIGARILQVVDVGNAIMEERSYKTKKHPKIAVRQIINGGRKGQFDPLLALECALMYIERYRLFDPTVISQDDDDIIGIKRELPKLQGMPETTRWGTPRAA